MHDNGSEVAGILADDAEQAYQRALKTEKSERARIRTRIANPLAAGHYYIHAAVGRGFEGRDPVAFRKNVADFVVYGTRSFGGVVALDCSAESEVEPRQDAGI